ncbi:MAG: YitT family protein, partial [Clostridia bacterium]|nr:YitT family protein [Clostridia bacterium]
MKNNIKKVVADLIFWTVGSFVYAAAVTMFISGNEISPGGITGIATVLGRLTSIPSGILLFLFNIPILILGLIKFGGVFIIKTAVASSILSLALTITDITLPSFAVDKILAAVFGGVLMGTGISLIMLRGATTGGIDIIAKLINRKFRHLTFGRLILFMDAVVIAITAIVYRNIESALYSVVAMYGTSYIMYMILYGGDKGKLIYIVTNYAEEICSDINSVL